MRTIKTKLEEYVELSNAFLLEEDPKKRLELAIKLENTPRPPVAEFGWGE